MLIYINNSNIYSYPYSRDITTMTMVVNRITYILMRCYSIPAIALLPSHQNVTPSHALDLAIHVEIAKIHCVLTHHCQQGKTVYVGSDESLNIVLKIE